MRRWQMFTLIFCVTVAWVATAVWMAEHGVPVYTRMMLGFLIGCCLSIWMVHNEKR